MPASEPYSLEGMAKQLGIGRAWVENHLDPDFVPERGIFPRLCLWDLRLKLGRFMQLPLIEDNYTRPQAALELGCSRQFVAVLIAKHDLPGERDYRTPTNRQIRGVPKATVEALRRLMPDPVPPGQVTTSGLRNRTGLASDTINARLAKVGLPATEFRHPNGHVLRHYDADWATRLLE